MGPLITAAFAHELTLPDICEQTNVRTKRGKDDREPQRTATVMASYLRCTTGHPHVVLANFGQTNFGQLWCYSHIVWPNTVMTKSGLWCGVCVVCSCSFRAAGASHDSPSPNVHISGSRPSNTTKIPREYPKGSKNIVAGEGRKSAKFWAPPFGSHRALPFGAPKRLKHQMGKSRFGQSRHQPHTYQWNWKRSPHSLSLRNQGTAHSPQSM